MVLIFIFPRTAFASNDPTFNEPEGFLHDRSWPARVKNGKKKIDVPWWFLSDFVSINNISWNRKLSLDQSAGFSPSLFLIIVLAKHGSSSCRKSLTVAVFFFSGFIRHWYVWIVKWTEIWFSLFPLQNKPRGLARSTEASPHQIEFRVYNLPINVVPVRSRVLADETGFFFFPKAAQNNFYQTATTKTKRKHQRKEKFRRPISCLFPRTRPRPFAPRRSLVCIRDL